MANKLTLKTNKSIHPVIYCFTTPNDHSHDGWCKIGYAEKTTADECIYQESRRTDTFCQKEWESLAVFDNGSYLPFKDHDFHNYLEQMGIERKKSTYEGARKPEYFKISPADAKFLLMKFKDMVMPEDAKREYTLREEQQKAVQLTSEYMSTSEKKEVLLNAKPRFGKTLTVYDYCKQKKAQNVLIVTNRPVIATSWYNDYVKFLGIDNYIFVSRCDAVKDLPYCYSREEYIKELTGFRKSPEEFHKRYIEFVSLQDLKTSKWFGGHYDKLRHVADMNWDILVVDESHEGVDTFKTTVAFKRIMRNETIYLSGTPFKQIASDRFPKEAIFNWTYAEEQEKKANWDYSIDEVNPYEDLPQLNLFTYRLSDMFADDLGMGEEIQRDKYYNLNDFFKASDKLKFENDADIDIFLDTITTVEKYPLANEETKSQIKHSLWLLDRVDSAKALAKKLDKHPAFAEYKIVIAAGDGKIDEDDKVDDSFKKVIDAINKYDKTITLSVGQLTTGITIPEWSAVFMLCNVKSPSLYIQASFRAQNPCLIRDDNGSFVRKENAYIFDFDPGRTLDIMEQFANDLYADTSIGKGTSQQRAKNIERLIKYFPIVGENDKGELVNYSPEDVMTIPAKIQSREIVQRGFMCNFLFQNIGRLFNDAKALEILSSVKEQKPIKSISTDNVKYDDNGETLVDATEITNKIDETIQKIDSEITKEEQTSAVLDLNDKLNPGQSFLDTLKGLKNPTPPEKKKETDKIVEEFAKERADRLKEVVSTAISQTYDGGIFNTKKVEKDIVDKFTEKVKEAKINHDIEMETLKRNFEEKQKSLTDGADIKQLVKDYRDAVDSKEFDFACDMEALENSFKQGVVSDTIKNIETTKQEKANKKAEDDWAFPKLKAFSRSIPAFLMAYGDENTTCDKFGEIINPTIFKEMTGIKLEDYMYFIEQHYFNEVAFNAAIKEFLAIRKELADYFDETNKKDIFDYIPPQETNQIFTPRNIVIKMLDLLEENNPGCFDDPDKTFIDPYMKSGLFITEIVKRLYRSAEIKKKIPDNHERLKNIFEKQVYGLAPTEIIYKISTNFIFGSELTKDFNKSHFIHLDAQPFAEKGTLDKELDKYFK